jgi:hypothetical protein
MYCPVFCITKLIVNCVALLKVFLVAEIKVWCNQCALRQFHLKYNKTKVNDCYLFEV